MIPRQSTPLASGLLTAVACALTLQPASGAQPNLLTNEWTLDIRSHSDSAPAVAPDGTIYFGTFKGWLWAVKPDGSEKWIFPTRNEIKSAPAVGEDGTVYFGSRDRKFYAVGANGKKRWEFITGGWVDSSPALAHDGTVYFGSWDNVFYALNADGTKRWHFPTAGAIVSSPAIGTDGSIYFGSHDKKFYALAPDGHKKWEFATDGPILSSPALNGDQCLYFTSVDGCLYALNLDGSLRWRTRTGGTTESSPVIAPDGAIYVGVRGNLWAVGANGKIELSRDADAATPFDSTPVILSNGLICWASHYGWLFYSKADGSLQFMYRVCDYGYGSPAIGPSGAIYLADQGGAFFGCAFSALRAGVSLAQTPWPKFRGNSRNTGNILDSAP